MAVPKKRHSKSKVGRKRMHLYIKAPHFIKCRNCGKDILPHQICPFCGFYKGKKVIEIEKETKKEKP